jgi:hypothetical protein
MDKENEHFHKILFKKSKKPTKKVSSGHPQHMTAKETLDELARADWAAAMKEVFKY